MPDKLSRLQSYSFKRPSGDVKFIRLKDDNKKKDNIDAKIASIKRDSKIKFTGRENEISELKRVYFSQKKQLSHNKELKNKFVKDISLPTPLVIGIKGEAGIGKSRLVSEFLRNIKVSLMGISDNSDKNPYSLFVSFIKSYCGISNSDSTDELKNKLKFVLNDLSNYEKCKPDKKNLLNAFNLLCHLLGINSKDYRLKLPASELKVYLQLSIKYFIETVAAKVNFSNEPLIIVCEDIHWIDDSSRNTLSYLFNTLNVNKNDPEQYRVMIFLLLYRPEFKVMKDAELKTEFTEIELEPLDHDSVQKILRSKSEKRKGNESLKLISDETVKLLAERSEGNPLFIQEWIKMYGDKYSNKELNKIKSNKLKSEKEEEDVPDSINLLINKRLERLNEKELHVLQYASVIGNEFSEIVLKKISELLYDAIDTEIMLKKLIENRFIKKSDKTFENEKHFEFFHDVIREVIYCTISEENIKILHKTTGEAIENLFHDKIEHYYYVLCEHFERGRVYEKTVEYLEKAGDRARENFENERAVGYYDKLCEKISKKNKEFYYKLVLKKLQVLKLVGRWKEGLEICEGLMDKDLKKLKRYYYYINIENAESLFYLSNFSDSIKLLKRIYKTAEEESENDIREKVCSLLCLNYIHCGQNDNAEKFAKILSSNNFQDNNKLKEAKVLDFLGQINSAKGNFLVALEYYKKCIEIYKFTGDLIHIPFIYNRIGTIYFARTEFNKAKINYDKALAYHLRTGNMLGYSYVLGNIGNFYNNTGRIDKALELYKKKLDLSKTSGNREGVASSIALIGNYYLFNNDYEMALDNYKKALSIYKEMNRKQSIANMLSNIGLINFYKGNYGEALDYYTLQTKICELISNQEGILRGVLNLGNLHKAMHNVSEAESYYRKAIKMGKTLEGTGMLSLAYFNYSELLYEQKKYCDAKSFNDLALTTFKKEDRTNHRIEINLLSNKISFCLSFENDTIDNTKEESYFCKVKLKNIFNETQSFLKETKDKVLIAKVHFELWEMAKRMKEQNQTLNQRSLALRLYKQIYKKVSNLEFRNKITKLNAQ